MAVFNLGSINIDNVYQLPHLPAPGETLAAAAFQQGMGGKGANMSVAIARGAGRAIHIGAVGRDGRWAVDRLMEYGVDTRHIAESSEATGHANICVDAIGENSIVLFPGANRAISPDAIAGALAEAKPADIALMQNETNAQVEMAQQAREAGLQVIYAAAPFDVAAVQAVVAHVNMLVMNEVEAAQLLTETGSNLADLPVSDVIVTKGAKGCVWISDQNRAGVEFKAIPAEAIDTTGAGDTFTGFLVAGLDRGLPMEQSILLGTRAASLMVSRLGTADVIPDLKEIEDHFLT